jgi:hypothetical protein
MDEGLKNKAYLEGQRLKKAGYDNVVILARLDKLGIPEDLALQVVRNLSIQQRVDIVKEQKPFFNIAILRVAIGVFLAIVSFILIPGQVYLPLGFIASGVVAAVIAKQKM